MPLSRKTIIHYSILAAALLTVWLTQHLPGWGECYAAHVYPVISKILSLISGKVPFSLGDVFIYCSILGLIAYPFYARYRKVKWRRILKHSITYLAWIYVWFYLAWGLNYFQPNFYQRTDTPRFAYSEETFTAFLNAYIDSLNSSYLSPPALDKGAVAKAINDQYRQLPPQYGIHTLKGEPRAKQMLCSAVSSKMAITGYMGPFFNEFNLNSGLLPTQYAEVYAHELSHFLGISSEAEANFYAYLVCTTSDDEFVRFCGYFSVFGYIMGNARHLLPEADYAERLARIRPEIIELYEAERAYWRGKYSKTIGDVQNRIYDLYLKGNRIEGGMKNYSEVVGLLVSWWNHTNAPLSKDKLETIH